MNRLEVILEVAMRGNGKDMGEPEPPLVEGDQIESHMSLSDYELLYLGCEAFIVGVNRLFMDR